MKKNILKSAIKWLISIIIIAISYWFALVPINFKSQDFWTFVVWAIVVCVAVNAFSQIFDFLKTNIRKKVKVDIKTKIDLSALGAPVKIAVVSILSIIVLSILVSIIGSEIFNAKAYNNLITITDGDFTEDVAEISMEQIPIVDRDTASRLAQRKLGEMSDLVSQFEIEDIYTQINYRGKPVRVTPLVYGDLIKWFNNQDEGIPAYIMVDMTTQETTLVRLDKGIKYSESEYFMRDLKRALRFKYPTKIFGDISFEIDDDGTPYWVASTVDYKIGLWNGTDINGAVLLNAVTGESKYYKLDKIPSWVDQVFESDMVIEQLVYNGKYRSGYWNSVFGQRGVLQPTDGYNYLAIGDDVYLYTGMTSVTSDESNVGFVLTNLRTKETKFYSIPGAEEYSAMSSAEGQVQHLNYSATFPLLLNVSNRPTYFMSLKDDAGLVKMYAFVDVSQYQIVGTGNSVKTAQNDYIAKLKDENISEDIKPDTVDGIIEEISSVVIDGNTIYYIKLKDNDKIYTAKVTVSDNLPFTKIDDKVTFTLNGNTVTKIEYK